MYMQPYKLYPNLDRLNKNKENMKLNTLTKIKNPSKKRVGRGIGSGLGKTSGRGTKGQKARGRMGIGFTGAGLPTYKKLPNRSGYGNRSVTQKAKVIDLSMLNIFKANSIIDVEQLLNLKLVTKKDLRQGVKVLADGKLTKKLTVKLLVSKKAKAEIEKMGGGVKYV